MASSALPSFEPPPYDPELDAVLKSLTFSPSITRDDIPRIRELTSPTADSVLAGITNIEHEERTITGPDGDLLLLSIFRPIAAETAAAVTTPPPTSSSHSEPHTNTNPLRPCIYFIHGGGMFTGTRFLGLSTILPVLTDLNALCISIEYRLPPEHPHPAPIEDCYTGLLWTAAHATDLGIDPANISIAGISAGGGIAAGLALLVRDRGRGPKLRAQLLECPMLDDRNDSVSARQFNRPGSSWSRGSNGMGWGCLLGGEKRAGSGASDDNDEQVSIYAAPARAKDLAGLPPAYIGVGSAEVFRDEAVNYAMRIWAVGGVAELHVWPGGFHGFTEIAGDARVSLDAKEVRRRWVGRVLGKGEGEKKDGDGKM